MDENKKTNIMETNIPLSPAPETALSWRDGAIPVLALALAWLFWENFDPIRMVGCGLPHLGVPILVSVHFGAVFVILGRRARITAGGLVCMAASLVLGACCAAYALDAFVTMNCLVILLTAAMATFALSGRLRCGADSALRDTVTLSFSALFTRLDRPFRAAGQLCRRGRTDGGQAALAVAVAVPVLAVVLWLLSSADAVFGSLFARLDLSDRPADLFVRALRVLVLALFLASALYFVRESAPAPSSEKPAKARHAAPFLLVTAMLDIVYIIFCYIQIKYLFGGAKEASMAGGWAEYARSGFFQLVTITAINLGLCLLGTDRERFASPGGRILRASYGLLLVLTAVILVSAFWRMRLYILAFGMSVLRLCTLWAMAVIAVGAAAAGWKLIRPDFGFFRAAGGFALGLWCIMALANPGGMIARFNVDGYVSGTLEELDTRYLASLGPDILPSLPPLQQAGPEGEAAFDSLVRQLSRSGSDDGGWTRWNLSAYRAARQTE